MLRRSQIEDNVSNLRLVEQIIARQPGVELITAMDGGLGIDLARERHPDLILLDLHLPDMPGAEVLRRLRTHDDTRTIPVVVLSADATERQITLALARPERSATSPSPWTWRSSSGSSTRRRPVRRALPSGERRG